MTIEATEQTTLVVEYNVLIEQSVISQPSQEPNLQRLIIRGEFILNKEEMEKFVKELLAKGITNHTKDIPTTAYILNKLTGTLIHDETE